MRWFVEISPMGGKGNDDATLCVEAPQWQPALQKARAIRGDDGALSNFSIELLDEGYRAIDPTTRLRYVVRRAPDDAPLSAGALSERPPAARPASVAPGPASSEKVEKRPLAHTLSYGSAGAARIEPGAVATPSAAGPTDLPSFVVTVSREDEATVDAPLTYREYAYALAGGTTEDDARRLILDRLTHIRGTLEPGYTGKLVHLAVFDHVFQGKPQRRPLVTLTWKDWRGDTPELKFPGREAGREASDGKGARPSGPAPAFASAPAKPASTFPPAAPVATVSAAATVEERPLAPVARSVSPEPVTNGASGTSKPPAVAEPFVAKPTPAATPTTPPNKTSPPPAVETPRPKSVRPPAVETPRPKSAPPPAVEAIPAAVELPSAVESPLTRAKPEAEVPTTVPLTAGEPPQASVEPAVTDTASMDPGKAAVSLPGAAPPSEASLDAGVPALSPIPAQVHALAAPPAAAPSVVPSSSAKAGKRLAGEDLLSELFEAFGDLHFAHDALEGAELVLQRTLANLPAEVGLVSLFDMNTREFVVVRQSGGAHSALCARQREKAPLAREAMRRRHAVVVSSPAEAARAVDDRWRALGVELKSLICAPVELNGRYLGLIELANPLDGVAFNEGDGNALTYIGQQLGELVAARGVIVDPAHIRGEAVQPSAPPPPASTRPSQRAPSGKNGR